MTAYPTEHGAAAAQQDGARSDASVGQLVGEIAEDLSRLMRQQLELAKAELKQEAAKAGTGAGMLGGAGVAGYLVALFVSVAAMVGLGHVIGLGWSALVVAAAWGVAAAVLFSSGRSRLGRVNPKPQRSIETLKEDAQWARHPTS